MTRVKTLLVLVAVRIGSMKARFDVTPSNQTLPTPPTSPWEIADGSAYTVIVVWSFSGLALD